jgi:protein-disulfide isomerase
MAKKTSSSVSARREQHRAEQQKKKRTYYTIAGVSAVAIVALFVVARLAFAPSVEDVVIPDPLEAPATADGKAWGPVDAPILIEEYADFQCPFCGQFALTTSKQLAEAYADTGLVRFEYNHFPFIGSESVRAAEAAECAREQGMFWQYHDTVYSNQNGENIGTFSNAALKNFAVAIGLDADAFDECFDDDRYAQLVQQELSEGRDRGISSTPTLFVDGEIVEGAVTFEQLQAYISANAPTE